MSREKASAYEQGFYFLFGDLPFVMCSEFTIFGQFFVHRQVLHYCTTGMNWKKPQTHSFFKIPKICKVILRKKIKNTFEVIYYVCLGFLSFTRIKTPQDNFFQTKGPGAKKAIRKSPGYFNQILTFESRKWSLVATF